MFETGEEAPNSNMFSRYGTIKPTFTFTENVMIDTEEIASSDLNLRGYEVTAIVVCSIIVLAIFMCYLTWKLRYKIVLRTVKAAFSLRYLQYYDFISVQLLTNRGYEDIKCLISCGMLSNF